MNDTGIIIVAVGGVIGSCIVAVATVLTAMKLQQGETDRQTILQDGLNKRTHAQFQHEINLMRADRLRTLFEPFVDLQLVIEQLVTEASKAVTDVNGKFTISPLLGARIESKSMKASDFLAAVRLDPDCTEIAESLNIALKSGIELLSKASNPEFNPVRDIDEISRLNDVFEQNSNTAIQHIHSELASLSRTTTAEI